MQPRRPSPVNEITACTVVQAVVKANSQSNGNGQISTTRGAKTPERMLMKPKIYNYIVFMTTHANPCGGATTWVVSSNAWHVTCFGFLGDLFSFFLYSCDLATPSPVDRFWRSIRRMTCFRAVMCLFGVPSLPLAIYWIKSPKIPNLGR